MNNIISCSFFFTSCDVLFDDIFFVNDRGKTELLSEDFFFTIN